jgi:hypothetical protein
MKNSASYFTLLAFLTLNSLCAQGGGANYLDVKSTLGNLNTLGGATQNGVWSIPKVEDKTITGTDYLFKSFEGFFVVTNKAGNSFKLLNLNYNLTYGTLETKISKDSVFQYDLKEIEYVVAGNKKYKNLNESTLEGLVLEIFKGKTFELYKKIDVSVQEGTINPLTQEKIQQDKYVQSYAYYTKANGNIEKIKFNKSAILKLTKDKQTQVKEYAKANNLDFSNETDINIILKYYESL